jgi:hypothetical protein
MAKESSVETPKQEKFECSKPAEVEPLAEGLLLTRMFRDFFKLNLANKIFVVMIVSIIPALIPFLISFDKLLQDYKDKNPAYPWPEYDDLLIALYSCIVMLVLKNYVERLAPYADRFISQRYQAQDRKERSKRFVYCLLKASYFTFAVLFAYFTLKDSDFTPPQLGGSGDLRNVFKDYPYQSHDSVPYLRSYVMVELGYHLHSLVDLLLHKSRNDFVEMLLHHLATCFLTSLAYFLNYSAVSALVLMVHDISDVFVSFCRAFTDTPYTALSLSLFAGLYSTFAYYRLYFFPFHLIYQGYYLNPGTISQQHQEQNYGLHVLGFMVHCLVALHVYWFFLLTKMFTRYWDSGVTRDLQQKLPSAKKAN